MGIKIDWNWWQDRIGQDSQIQEILFRLGSLPPSDHKSYDKRHRELEGIYLSKIREIFERVSEELSNADQNQEDL